ncbi:MAG: transcription termination factor Rho, partial [Thermoleophilaceae bacterium]|nr:transcription termination factor Rho [Thermoleophilaceae bacterium]
MPVLDRKELEESPLADLHAIASELGIEGYRKLRKEQLIEALVAGEAPSDDGPSADSGDSGDDEDRPRTRSRRGRGGSGRGRSESGSGSGSGSRGGRGRGRGAARDADDGDAREAKASKRDEDERDDDASDEPEEERSGVLDVLPNGSGFMRPEAFEHSPEDVYVSPAQIRRCELRPGDELTGGVRKPRRNERHPSLVRVDKVNGADAEQPAERPRFEDLTPVFATQALTSPDGLDNTPFGRGSRVA